MLLPQNPISVNQFRLRRGFIFGVIIVTALFAFEIFNYSTTDYALSDLLGDLKFAGIRWATILSIAFCGIDFAGIARLFTPQSGSNQGSAGHSEAWYLFGAWMLAATMNAMLTWWGVSLAILGHDTLGNAVVSRGTLLRVVPIFVSILVWLIRILIIGTFSVAGEQLFGQDDVPVHVPVKATVKTAGMRPTPNLTSGRSSALRPPAASTPVRSVPKNHASAADEVEGAYNNRPDPTYHPLAAKPAYTPNGSQNSPAKNPVTRNGTTYRRP